MKKAFLILALILNACTSSEKTDRDLPVINIADNIGKGYLLNISEIAESIEYIPLETTDSSILGIVQEVYYSNGFFVINTLRNTSGIFRIFDKDGKYYNTLNRKGRGPEEYAVVYCLDVYKNNIIVLDAKKIAEYSFDGKCIRIIPLEKEEATLGFSNVKKLDDNHYLLTCGLGSKSQTKYSALILDSSGKTDLLFNYPQSEIELSKNRPGLYKSLSGVIIFGNNGIGKVISGDNEYIMSHDKEFKNIDTINKINYGKYQLTKNNVSTSNKNSKKIRLTYPPLESRNFMFLYPYLYALAHKPMKLKSQAGRPYVIPLSCALYDKRDGTFRLIDQPEDYQKGFVEDIEGGPAFWPDYISEDEYMISFVNAPEFIERAQNHKVSEKFKKIAEGLKETDNPVLVRVKLKN
jgi:hypothetical protein